MRLLIVGAGGHGVAVADAAAASQEWSDIVFVDDAFEEFDSVGDWQVAGDVSSLTRLRHEVDAALAAIGDNTARMRLVSAIEDADIPLATVIHPRAVVSSMSNVGAATVLLANAVVNPRARIGKGCIVNTGAIVEHDCDIADGVHVAPGATLAADVRVGAKSWIGAGASIREQVSVGSEVVVGLGAAVIHDVGNGMTVAGVPARPIGSGESQRRAAGSESES